MFLYFIQGDLLDFSLDIDLGVLDVHHLLVVELLFLDFTVSGFLILLVDLGVVEKTLRGFRVLLWGVVEEFFLFAHTFKKVGFYVFLGL